MTTHPARRGVTRTAPMLTGSVPATGRVTPRTTQPSSGPVGPATSSADQQDERVLLTPEQAAELLQVRPSWLRRKAAARAVPCRFLGKHLRFSRTDVEAIAAASARPARSHRYPRDGE